VRSQKINTAIVTCLEHVATSTAPPGAGAADFLLRLLDDQVFTIDEVDEITIRVSIIFCGGSRIGISLASHLRRWRNRAARSHR
jgi:hypothetical protein